MMAQTLGMGPLTSPDPHVLKFQSWAKLRAKFMFSPCCPSMEEVELGCAEEQDSALPLQQNW